METITYKDIERVNNTLCSTEIKGKLYIEVNQRIKAFRMLYPQGFIETEMLQNENGICVFKAIVGYTYTILDDDKVEFLKFVLGTGTAYEKEGSTFINKTSYIENCETSAVGRALGMAGFGIDTSVASAEEVQNAIANQEEKKATKEQIEKLKGLLSEEKIESMLVYYKVKSIEDMLYKDAEEVIKRKS